jgi:hypothetical protein
VFGAPDRVRWALPKPRPASSTLVVSWLIAVVLCAPVAAAVAVVGGVVLWFHARAGAVVDEVVVVSTTATNVVALAAALTLAAPATVGTVRGLLEEGDRRWVWFAVAGAGVGCGGFWAATRVLEGTFT